MDRSVSTIVFIAVLALVGYFFWAAFSPYYFHDVAPNAPMQTIINGKPWYFPMGYMEPHYQGTEYVRGGEAEVWLTINAADFKIIPQDVAKDTLKIGPAIDVVLSGDTNPKAKKALEELQALKKMTGFEVAPYNLQSKIIGTGNVYFAKNTHISCGKVNCTLFTTEIPGVNTAMVFNAQLLPQWRNMIDILSKELEPFRTKPPLTNVFKDYFTMQPVGAQRDSTTTNSILMPSDRKMPETTVPSLNTK